MADATPSTSLRSAVEGLYKTFERYHVETLVGCPCCTSDEHGRHLARCPVRSLTPTDLGRYSWKAMTTWGTVDDFKHFLPRVLELTITYDPEWQLEVVFGKLAYGDWSRWPQAERVAIEAFLHAFWLVALDRFPFQFDIETVLCAIGNAVDDLSPFTSEWELSQAESAALHLGDFIHNTAWSLPNTLNAISLSSAFWQQRPKQAVQALRWLTASARKDMLEAAFFRSTDAAAQVKLSDAITEHDQLCQRFIAAYGRLL